jgi:signal transduction histidine kinase
MCRVSVRRQVDTVVIAVEDDGMGFDAKIVMSGAQGGLGLLGIRERATHLGGTVRLETIGERGARVTVELPARWRSETADIDRLMLNEPIPGSRGSNG